MTHHYQDSWGLPGGHPGDQYGHTMMCSPPLWSIATKDTPEKEKSTALQPAYTAGRKRREPAGWRSFVKAIGKKRSRRRRGLDKRQTRAICGSTYRADNTGQPQGHRQHRPLGPEDFFPICTDAGPQDTCFVPLVVPLCCRSSPPEEVMFEPSGGCQHNTQLHDAFMVGDMPSGRQKCRPMPQSGPTAGSVVALPASRMMSNDVNINQNANTPYQPSKPRARSGIRRLLLSCIGEKGHREDHYETGFTGFTTAPEEDHYSDKCINRGGGCRTMGFFKRLSRKHPLADDQPAYIDVDFNEVGARLSCVMKEHYKLAPPGWWGAQPYNVGRSSTNIHRSILHAQEGESDQKDRVKGSKCPHGKYMGGHPEMKVTLVLNNKQQAAATPREDDDGIEIKDTVLVAGETQKKLCHNQTEETVEPMLHQNAREKREIENRIQRLEANIKELEANSVPKQPKSSPIQEQQIGGRPVQNQNGESRKIEKLVRRLEASIRDMEVKSKLDTVSKCTQHEPWKDIRRHVGKLDAKLVEMNEQFISSTSGPLRDMYRNVREHFKLLEIKTRQLEENLQRNETMLLPMKASFEEMKTNIYKLKKMVRNIMKSQVETYKQCEEKDQRKSHDTLEQTVKTMKDLIIEERIARLENDIKGIGVAKNSEVIHAEYAPSVCVLNAPEGIPLRPLPPPPGLDGSVFIRSTCEPLPHGAAVMKRGKKVKKKESQKNRRQNRTAAIPVTQQSMLSSKETHTNALVTDYALSDLPSNEATAEGKNTNDSAAAVTSNHQQTLTRKVKKKKSRRSADDKLKQAKPCQNDRAISDLPPKAIPAKECEEAPRNIQPVGSSKPESVDDVSRAKDSNNDMVERKLSLPPHCENDSDGQSKCVPTDPFPSQQNQSINDAVVKDCGMETSVIALSGNTQGLEVSENNPSHVDNGDSQKTKEVPSWFLDIKQSSGAARCKVACDESQAASSQHLCENAINTGQPTAQPNTMIKETVHVRKPRQQSTTDDALGIDTMPQDQLKRSLPSNEKTIAAEREQINAEAIEHQEDHCQHSAKRAKELPRRRRQHTNPVYPNATGVILKDALGMQQDQGRKAERLSENSMVTPIIKHCDDINAKISHRDAATIHDVLDIDSKPKVTQNVSDVTKRREEATDSLKSLGKSFLETGSSLDWFHESPQKEDIIFDRTGREGAPEDALDGLITRRQSKKKTRTIIDSNVASTSNSAHGSTTRSFVAKKPGPRKDIRSTPKQTKQIIQTAEEIAFERNQRIKNMRREAEAELIARKDDELAAAIAEGLRTTSGSVKTDGRGKNTQMSDQPSLSNKPAAVVLKNLEKVVSQNQKSKPKNEMKYDSDVLDKTTCDLILDIDMVTNNTTKSTKKSLIRETSEKPQPPLSKPDKKNDAVVDDFDQAILDILDSEKPDLMDQRSCDDKPPGDSDENLNELISDILGDSNIDDTLESLGSYKPSCFAEVKEPPLKVKTVASITETADELPEWLQMAVGNRTDDNDHIPDIKFPVMCNASILKSPDKVTEHPKNADNFSAVERQSGSLSRSISDALTCKVKNAKSEEKTVVKSVDEIQMERFESQFKSGPVVVCNVDIDENEVPSDACATNNDAAKSNELSESEKHRLKMESTYELFTVVHSHATEMEVAPRPEKKKKKKKKAIKKAFKGIKKLFQSDANLRRKELEYNWRNRNYTPVYLNDSPVASGTPVNDLAGAVGGEERSPTQRPSASGSAALGDNTKPSMMMDDPIDTESEESESESESDSVSSGEPVTNYKRTAKSKKGGILALFLKKSKKHK